MSGLTSVRRDRWRSLKPGAMLVVYARGADGRSWSAGDVYAAAFARHLVGPRQGTPERPGIVLERNGVELHFPHDRIAFVYRSQL